MTAPNAWNDISDQRDWQDSAEPVLITDPTENIEAAEPMLASDATEPTLPMDSADPCEAMDSTESVDQSDHRDEPGAMATLSSLERMQPGRVVSGLRPEAQPPPRSYDHGTGALATLAQLPVGRDHKNRRASPCPPAQRSRRRRNRERPQPRRRA